MLLKRVWFTQGGPGQAAYSELQVLVQQENEHTSLYFYLSLNHKKPSTTISKFLQFLC